MDLIQNQNARVADALDRIVAEHGLWRVAAAVVVRAFQRRGRPVPLHHLPDAVLRDVGLPEPMPGPSLALHRLGTGR